MRPKVYLAGPIAGLTYDQGQDWRLYAQSVLDNMGIDGFSPLRGKEHLKQIGKLSAWSDSTKHSLTSGRAIMARDHNDVQRADLVLVNYDGVTKPSRGTDMEMAWAYAYRKPLVVCATVDIIDHPMVQETIDFYVDNLDSALDLVREILLPGKMARRCENLTAHAVTGWPYKKFLPHELDQARHQNEGGF